jgi:hypothetical protein
MKSSSASFLVYFGLIAAAIAGYFQMLPNGFLVAITVTLVFLPLFDFADESIPFDRLAALIATSQWLVGAALQYQSDTDFGRYQMYVPADVYFRFAIPATCLFAACLIAFSGRPQEGRLLRRRNCSQDFQIGVILLLVSTGAMMAVRFGMVSGQLAFLMNLVFQFRYVATLYFYFSGHRYRWPLIALSLSSLITVAGASAMFHDLILWLAVYFFYFLTSKKRSFLEKSLYFSGLFAAIIVIQMAKGDYRAKVWSGQNPSFLDSVMTTIFEQGGLRNGQLRESAITRLNQGWIISAVMRHVPEREPFANGETLATALKGAFLPRFLAPDKKKAGGQEGFRRFTGLGLQDSTSMAISPLGEAYANYGSEGGILLMMVWGALFGGMLRIVRNISTTYPTIILWVPLFVYQAIKAETEFLTVFNQLSKGGVVAFGTYYLIHHYLLKNDLILEEEEEVEFNPVQIRGSLADIERH